MKCLQYNPPQSGPWGQWGFGTLSGDRASGEEARAGWVCALPLPPHPRPRPHSCAQWEPCASDYTGEGQAPVNSWAGHHLEALRENCPGSETPLSPLAQNVLFSTSPGELPADREATPSLRLGFMCAFSGLFCLPVINVGTLLMHFLQNTILKSVALWAWCFWWLSLGYWMQCIRCSRILKANKKIHLRFSPCLFYFIQSPPSWVSTPCAHPLSNMLTK